MAALEEIVPVSKTTTKELNQGTANSEVLNRVLALEEEYILIVNTFTRLLVQDSGRVIQSDLQQYANSLPVPFQKYHHDLIKRNQPSAGIENAISASHFVDALYTFSNFLNPALIDDAISKYGDEETKSWMQTYKKKLHDFEAATTLKEFSQISWKGSTPPDYRQFEAEISEGSQCMKTINDMSPVKCDRLWLLKKVCNRGKTIIYSIPADSRSSPGIQNFIKKNFGIMQKVASYEPDEEQTTEEHSLPDPTTQGNPQADSQETHGQFTLPKRVDFSFSQITEKDVELSHDGLKACRKKSNTRFNGGVYIATPLSGTFEFEIEVKVKHLVKTSGSLWLGIGQCKKGSYGHLNIPYVDKKDKGVCTWCHDSVYNYLHGHDQPVTRNYGSVNLDNIRDGDRLGMQISSTGVLSFFFNGKNLGVAVREVYSDEYDVYPFVNVCGNCNAVEITRAVMTGHVDQVKPAKSTDIKFGLHPISKKGVVVVDDELYARRVGSGVMRYGVSVCGTIPLKGQATFEVYIDECLPNLASFKFGVRMIPANAPLSQYDEQMYNLYGSNHCIWDGGSSLCIYNVHGVPPIKDKYYGSASLHQGDRVGLELLRDGSLIFYHNGNSLGVAVTNIYQKFKDYDVYPFVCFNKDCLGVQVTRAEIFDCATFFSNPYALPVVSQYYLSAMRVAHVPFVEPVAVYTCDHRKRQIKMEEHDITITIPEGAIPEGLTVHLEVGVAIIGPFNFSGSGRRPVSPILWMCPQEALNFQKSFTITLPHFLTKATAEDLENIVLSKATEHCYHITPTGQRLYDFKTDPDSDRPNFFSNDGVNYGSFQTNHCCLYCLEDRKWTRDEMLKAGYSLHVVNAQQAVYFCVTFYLSSCSKAIEKQFPHSKIQKPIRVDLQPQIHGSDMGPHIQIKLDEQLTNINGITQIPENGIIKASMVDFWGCSQSSMKHYQKYGHYPPRVELRLNQFTPQLSIKGITDDATVLRSINPHLKLSIESVVYQQSGNIPKAFHLEPTKFSDEENDDEDIAAKLSTIDDKPLGDDDWDDVVEVLADKLIGEWRDVGRKLHIKPPKIDEIASNHAKSCKDCLSKVAQEWLQGNYNTAKYGEPSWRHLAKAMSGLSMSVFQCIAREHSQQY